MRYVVFGAGAIGGGLGGRLAETGQVVTLVARGDHLLRLRETGLQLRTPGGVSQPPVDVVPTIDAAGLESGDMVILAMKSQDTEAALLALDDAGVRDVNIACAQNGVANEGLAARHGFATYGMRVFVRASHLEPGVVRLHSAPIFGVIDIGRYPSGSDPVAQRVAADLVAAGFDAVADTAIMRLKHAKLLGNLGNVLNAACGAAAYRSALLDTAQDEARRCFAAAGIDVADPDESKDRIARLLSQPAGDDDYPGSSSWQSLTRHGRLETDWLNGEIVLLGTQYHVPTPVNTALRALGSWLVGTAVAPGRVPIESVEEWIAAGGAGYPGGSSGSRRDSTRAMDRR